jgi:two-component sensor histidine kinase
MGSVSVPTDRAVPVGLLVSELVTNAFKYAYPGRAGEIRVSLGRAGAGEIRLQVADQGQGLPAEFDLKRPTSSLGVRLINGFTRQIGGKLQVLSGETGTRFVVDFQATEQPG